MRNDVRVTVSVDIWDPRFMLGLVALGYGLERIGTWLLGRCVRVREDGDA